MFNPRVKSGSKVKSTIRNHHKNYANHHKNGSRFVVNGEIYFCPSFYMVIQPPAKCQEAEEDCELKLPAGHS